MNRSPSTRVFLFVLTVGLLGGVAQPASAQIFLSPIVGYNFGGDSGCPEVTGCSDKNLNLGIAFGDYGKIFGIEEEFAYAKDFFGNSPAYESSVVTLMANFMITPDISRVKPYALIGIGLMKSNVEFGALKALSAKNNRVAWDIGGGVTAQFSDRLGLRADVRFFKSLQDFTLRGVSIAASKLNFARAGVGVLFFF